MVFGVEIGDLILGLLPMILLIGAWYIFMRRFSGPHSHQARCLQMMERQTNALERIAAALERRS